MQLWNCWAHSTEIKLKTLSLPTRPTLDTSINICKHDKTSHSITKRRIYLYYTHIITYIYIDTNTINRTTSTTAHKAFADHFPSHWSSPGGLGGYGTGNMMINHDEPLDLGDFGGMLLSNKAKMVKNRLGCSDVTWNMTWERHQFSFCFARASWLNFLEGLALL